MLRFTNKSKPSAYCSDNAQQKKHHHYCRHFIQLPTLTQPTDEGYWLSPKLRSWCVQNIGDQLWYWFVFEQSSVYSSASQCLLKNSGDEGQKHTDWPNNSDMNVNPRPRSHKLVYPSPWDSLKYIGNRHCQMLRTKNYILLTTRFDAYELVGRVQRKEYKTFVNKSGD